MGIRCPNCNSKQLLWNYDKKRLECPKEKMNRKGQMEKYGCGYKNISPEQREL